MYVKYVPVRPLQSASCLRQFVVLATSFHGALIQLVSCHMLSLYQIPQLTVIHTVLDLS